MLRQQLQLSSSNQSTGSGDCGLGIVIEGDSYVLDMSCSANVLFHVTGVGMYISVSGIAHFCLAEWTLLK